MFARQAHAVRPSSAELFIGDAPAVLPELQALVRIIAHLRRPAGARPRLHPVCEPRERKPPAQRLLGQAFRVAGAVLLAVAGHQPELIALAADPRDSLAQG